MSAPTPEMPAILGHFRIAEKLGAGGMGEVYRARDQHLERDVAIKVLPRGTLADEPARKRFHKEALSLSRVNHPNVATIFDFASEGATDFLVMEYIAGTALSELLEAGPLAEGEIIAFALQMTQGLEAAHRQGVVHCDLKPGNLRITVEGRLKILDFGVARLMPAATASSPTQSAPYAGGGTLPYMAPEQLRGEAVDPRTDIHAAGVVLYEMATGRRPFAGSSAPLLIEDILHRMPAEPESVQPGVSRRLGEVISRCLQKDPTRRYQSARELGAALARVAGAAPTAAARRRRSPARIRSLAVLPLANLSRNPDEEFFSDGMTEELITSLAKIGALKVISRTSAMRFKGSNRPLPEIARELNVDAIVEGSVLRAGNQVRISAQLIHAASDEHVWAESYQREMREVLSLQSEIARAIADEIRVKITPQERVRLGRAQAVNPAAHEAYLQGLHHWNRFVPDGFRRAIECFQRATALDPNYAAAYGGLAQALAYCGYWGAAPEKQMYPLAKAAALRALELDEACSAAHAAMGTVRWFYDWQPAAAEAELHRSLELNPGNAVAHISRAVFLAVWKEDREQARAAIERARELDPLAPLIAIVRGWMHLWADEYDDAIALMRRTLEVAPEAGAAWSILGVGYGCRGDYPQALAALEKSVALSGDALAMGWLGAYYATAGQKQKALAVLAQLQERAQREPVFPMNFANIYVGLGDYDEAFRWLERAYEERVGQLYWLKVGPVGDPLHADPRFWDLVRRMGLPH